METFRSSAEQLVDRGADVLMPAGVLPALLISDEKSLMMSGVPIVNCAAIALKSAEMWAQLRNLTGVEPSRGPSFRLAGETSKADFISLFSGD